ncbi:hypothetical protein C8J57DRAFT_1254228 [Mycena rebaudengoi]|nr:hypothetical protein C8J57DRAFT_1254228 [Mycena rebaudengoi]
MSTLPLVLRIPHGSPDGRHLCLPPWFPDNLNDKWRNINKFYLVTGKGVAVEHGGAYNLWTSAHHRISGVGCGLGGHFHEVDPQLKHLTDAVTSPSLHAWCEAGVLQHQHSCMMRVAASVATESLGGTSEPLSPVNTPAPSLSPAVVRKRGVAPPSSSPVVTPLSPCNRSVAGSKKGVLSVSASPASNRTDTRTLSITAATTSSLTTSVATSAPAYSSMQLPIPSMEELMNATRDMPGLCLGITCHLNAEGRERNTTPVNTASASLRCGEEDVVLSLLEEADELFHAQRQKWIKAQLRTLHPRIAEAQAWQQEFEEAKRAEDDEERRWRRRRRVVQEAYHLQDVEELVCLHQHVVRLKAQWDGKDSEESTSFESVDVVEGGYSGHSIGEVVSEVEMRKQCPKTWCLSRANAGTGFFRRQDTLSYSAWRGGAALMSGYNLGYFVIVADNQTQQL